MVNYIYKQIHKEKLFYKILYSFIETHFFTNENPYGMSLSLRQHTCIYYFILCYIVYIGIVTHVMYIS